MRSKERITLAFTLIILGIVFADDWLIGYSLIIAGVLLSIISAIKPRRKAKDSRHQTGGGMMADFTWSILSIGTLSLIILIGILVLWQRLKDKKSGFPLVDERTQRLNWKAAYFAMFIGQYFIVAYLLINIIGREFFGMPEIEAGYPMIAALLASSVSFLGS